MTDQTGLARATRQTEILEKRCVELEKGNATLLQTAKDLTAWLEKMTAKVDELAGHRAQQTVEITKAATVSPEAIRAALKALPQDQVVDILLKASLKVAGHEIRPGRQHTPDGLAKAAAAPKTPPTPEEMRGAMWQRVIAQAFRTLPQEREPPVQGKW